MANPWDADEVVGQPARSAQPPAISTQRPPAGGMPWDADEVIGENPVAPQKSQPRPSLFRLDSDFRERANVSIPEMLGATAKDMFGSREGAAKFLAERTGGRVEKDERGDPVLSLPDGTRYRLNDPGIDLNDVANVAGNVAAAFLPASWAARVGQARNVGLAGRMGMQGIAAGATDAALQAGVNGGQIDPVRTAAATVGGAGGEAVGTGLAAVGSRAASTFNRVSGRNVARADDLLRQEGITPTPEAVNRLAATVPEIDAGANPNALLGANQYGFQYTQGQRATDPKQKFALLSQEELLRQSPAGGQVLRDAATNNVNQLDQALSGITTNLGGRPGTTPAELAAGAASRIRRQADELNTRISDAYFAAGAGNRTAVSIDAVSGLPQMLRTSVDDFDPNPITTPVTARTLSQIEDATNSLLASGEEGGGNVAGVTLKALETQRRILNNNINAATNKADRAAMVKIKREFDSWMDEAVDTALISGDPGALEALKKARALRAEFGRRFEGTQDSDRFISGMLDGSRTPEELVNIAFSASQVSKAGGARFIDRLRKAAADDPEVIGSLRAANFMRLTRGNNGEPLTMGQIVRNINTTEYNNASVVKALYSPGQWAEIKRLASALEPLVAKGDFARSSGTSERMARMLFSRIGGGLPIIGEMVKGVGEGVNVVRAQRALNQPLRLPARSGPMTPAVGAAATVEGSR